MSEKSQEPIHSGHFMTSNPHTEPQPDDEDEDVEVDVVEDDEKPDDIGAGTTKGERAALYEKPVTFYKFGPKKTQSIAIDVSLNKLNKCIKVAYNKMTTPKWKDFKGLRLHWKQRIRLNNVIWRAYYIEFRMPAKKSKKKTPFCYFAVPDDDTTHAKIEGSVLEGMYWKRRMEAVGAQYKKWRYYMKNRRTQHEKPVKRKRTYSEGQSERFDRELYERPAKREQRSQTPKNMSTDYCDFDDLENVFTDSLFESLSQPYMFPNPKEFGQSGNADIMQPGLLSLQPSLEEIMASLDRYDGEPSTSFREDALQSVCSSSNGQPIMDPAPQNVQPAHPMTLPQQSHMSLDSTQHRSAAVENRGPSSLSRQAQDYAVANMLVDYSNQAAATSFAQMPTRQSSSITSQMLMMSSTHAAQPQYSTASGYNSVPPVSNNPRPNSVQWKGTNFLLGNQDVMNTLEYMPQFLQSPPNILSGSAISMGCPPSTPARPWWMDSPLAAAAQSPLAAVASSLNGGNVTPLGPATPLGVGAGPSTPPSQLRSELRSPVVIRTMPVQLSPEMPTILSSPSTLTSVDVQNHFSRGGHVGVKHPSPTDRLEPHTMISLQKEEKMFISPSATKPDWISSLSPNLRSSSTIVTSPISQHRSAPATAEVHPNERTNPWKLSDLSDSGMFPQSHSYTIGEHINDEATESPSALGRVNIGASTSDKGDLKEELVLMSAPSSVKSSRGGSRQVQADSTLHPEERKRILHLHAEQNRRSALKDGFDMLMNLTAAREEQVAQRAALNEKIAKLNQRISVLQSNLPSSSGSANTKLEPRAALEAFYDRYTKERSRKDYRFWVMARLLRPIAVGENSSFAAMIAPEGSSREEIAASCSEWLNCHWRAAELRPLASSLLVHLATTAGVLTNPESLEDHIREQLNNPIA
ncbi:Helix-loop-helix DNA-binding domain protein [Trichostrongylus colubriformis]|uniref:Helix-loop-helix DNA-binding domain protein n=1 Tax=Trichostrongylus colubriformis TaxID=6319 RepID=A0AAN8FRQ8_TRICO